MGQWVEVDKQLPRHWERVIIYGPDKTTGELVFDIGYCNHDGDYEWYPFWVSDKINEPSHWMLPHLPNLEIDT